MASAQPQSSTSPWVLAHRVEQAARGEACARALRDADLVAVGAPPGGIALVGGTAQATRTHGAAEVALWLTASVASAGLLQPALSLYDAQRRGSRRVGAHTLHAPELAARELARQALDFATSRVLAGSSTQDVGGAVPLDESAAIALGWWLASVIEGAGLSTVARGLFEELRSNDTPSAPRDQHAISAAVAASVEGNISAAHSEAASSSPRR